MRKRYLYHIIFFVFCIAVFIESSFPSDSYPEIEFEFADKIVHLFVFFVLSVSAYLSFIHQEKFGKLKKYSYFFTILFVALYGASDEIHQLFVNGRTCDFFDWTADFFGAVFAVIVIISLKKLFKNKINILNSEYDTN